MILIEMTNFSFLCSSHQYVAHVVTLKLLSTSLTIKEDQNVAEILKVQIIDLSTKISQRPGAQAIK